MYGFAAIWVVRYWKQASNIIKDLALLPVAYLGAHFFNVLDAVYTRRFLVGHFAMGTIATYILSRHARTDGHRQPHPTELE